MDQRPLLEVEILTHFSAHGNDWKILLSRMLLNFENDCSGGRYETARLMVSYNFWER